MARREVLAHLRRRGYDPLACGLTPARIKTKCRRIVQRCWIAWCAGPGAPVLSACGITSLQATSVKCAFPWEPAFEWAVDTAP